MNSIMQKFSNEKINYLLLIAFLLNISMVIFYMFYTFENIFHSDAATKMLLAKEILETGEFFPTGWYYANNDIWVFFLHGLLVPLIRFLGFNYFTHAINSILYLLTYLLSAWFFINSFKITNSSKFLFLNSSLLSLSYFYSAFIFGEIAYITPIVYVFLSIGFIFRYLKSNDLKYLLFLSILIFLFTVHNPQRSLIYYFLPVSTTTVFLYFCTINNKNSIKKAFIFTLLSFILASFTYYYILQNVQIIKGANNLLFADYNRMLSNLDIFFRGLLNTFGLINRSQFSPFTFEGIVRLLNFSFFGLLLVSLHSFTKKTNLNQTMEASTLVYLLFGFVPVFFTYIFTIPLAQNEATFRYFYPIIILLYFILVFYIDKVKHNYLRMSLILFLTIFILINNYINYIKPYKNSENSHKILSQYLIENNLKYGFASYWHSYINNVFTNDKSKVYPINLATFEPFRWLSSERWFKMYNDYNKSFIVFTQDEYNQHSGKIFNRVKPIKIDTVDEFKIAIFEKNIAYDLNRVYQSKIEDGIDFRREGLPAFIKSVGGLSYYEVTHRWSEGKYTEIIFYKNLPNNFRLIFSGTPFNSMIGKQIVIKVGDKEKMVQLKQGYHEYEVEFIGVNSDLVKFIFENPKSPYELGISRDPRKLAFAFNFIKFEEKK